MPPEIVIPRASSSTPASKPAARTDGSSRPASGRGLGAAIDVVPAPPDDALRAAWCRLYDRAAAAPAAANPAWALPLLAAPILGGGGRIVTARHDGHLLAVAPLRIVGWRALAPADPFRRGGPALLVDPDLGAADRRALIERIADRLVDGERLAAVSRLDVDDDDELTTILLDRLAARGFSTWCRWTAPRHRIDLAPSFDAYLAARHTARRARILRQERRRAERRGGLRLERAAGPEVTDDHHRRIVAIERRSVLRRRGAPALAETWGRDLLAALAASGAARVGLLRIDGRDVAYTMGTVEHDRFHFEWTGYDTDYADVSPGKLLVAETIARCCDEGLAAFDFGIGDAAYKRFWADGASPVRRVAAARGMVGAARGAAETSLRTALSWPALQPAARRLRRAVRLARRGRRAAREQAA